MAGKFIALPLAAALIATGPAFAQQVGTATAVNPITESTLPGGSTNKLAVGARVMHNERIHTLPSGSTQVLFFDKSTLNVAPNTNLLIDEFVYDPASSSGHMLTHLSWGTLQYIGGKLSHQGAVTVNTPAAAVGIRGGTATIEHGAHGTQIINQYGTLTITNGAGTMVVTRPGFVVTIANWNAAPGQPTRVAEARVNRNIRYLSSTAGQNGGVPGLKSLATTNNPGRLWLPTDAGEYNASSIIQSTQRATLPTPPRITRGD
jgi:hypothetical protein